MERPLGLVGPEKVDVTQQASAVVQAEDMELIAPSTLDVRCEVLEQRR
jgi:hypothetical protein